MSKKLNGARIKILVCCHKPCNLPKNPDGIFLPVYVGAALRDSAEAEEQIAKWGGGKRR